MIKSSYLVFLFVFTLIPSYFAQAQEVLSDSQKNSVDIVWQGNSYTPPFYRGRALWPNQGEVIFTAVVNNNYYQGNTKNLNYKWVRNSTVQGALSGVGKNSFVYQDAGLFIPQRIRVDVLSGEVLIGRASVSINPTSPLVLIYENNPLLGFVFEREVKNSYNLLKEEVSFSAFPYYFSTTDKESNVLSYVWGANNTSISKSGNRVTFRTPEERGQSLVSIATNNIQSVSQSARKEFLVQFNDDSQF